MGFSKLLNINRNTKNYTNREIHEIFKTAKITDENLVFFKYLKTALTQMKQSKGYYCVAISNRVEYKKYLGYEWVLSIAFDKI